MEEDFLNLIKDGRERILEELAKRLTEGDSIKKIPTKELLNLNHRFTKLLSQTADGYQVRGETFLNLIKDANQRILRDLARRLVEGDDIAKITIRELLDAHGRFTDIVSQSGGKYDQLSDTALIKKAKEEGIPLDSLEGEA